MRPFAPLLLHFNKHNRIGALHDTRTISLTLPLDNVALCDNLCVGRLLSHMLRCRAHFSRLFFSCLRYVRSLTNTANAPRPTLHHFRLTLLKRLNCNIGFARYTNDNRPMSSAVACHCHRRGKFVTDIIVSGGAFAKERLGTLGTQRFPSTSALHTTGHFAHVTLGPCLNNGPLGDERLFQRFVPGQAIGARCR